MSKSGITKTWISGLVVFAAGIIVALFGVFVMLVFGGTFTQVGTSGNYNFTPDLNASFWSGVAVIVVGGLVTLVGIVVQIAAWVAALVNSYRLADKVWFVILLAGGVLSFAFGPLGLAAMIAYVVAAPDSTAAVQPAAPPPAPLATGRPLPA